EVGFTLGFGLMKFIGDSPLQKKKDIRAILTSNGVVIKASNKEAVEYLVERQKDQQKIKKFVEDSGITGVNVVVDKMYFTDSDVALSISGAEFEATTSIDTLRGHKINSRLGMSLSKAVAGLVRISNVVCLDDLIVGTTGSEDQGKDYRKTFARWFKEDRTIPEKLDWDLKIGAGLLCNTEKTLRSVNFVIADPGKCIWANPEDRKLEINNGSIPIHLQAYIDIMLMFPLHSSTILKEIENQEVALSDKDREMLNYAERIGRNQSLNKMAVSSHIHYVPRAHSG
ncbi:MAG: hypothetical protein KAH32_05335, partial [Chlamydiia bacterium]|nr:hypothetical protein [Chlamydiia bacterium]